MMQVFDIPGGPPSGASIGGADRAGVDSGPSSRVGSPAVERHPVGSPRHNETGSLLSQYETGESGTLHTVYADLMEQWLADCVQNGKSY